MQIDDHVREVSTTMEERYIKQKKWIAIIGIILLCTLIITAIVIVIHYENRHLIAVNDHLEAEIAGLESDREILELANENLQDKVISLEVDVNRFEDQAVEMEELRREAAGLVSDVERFEGHLYFLQQSDYAVHVTVDERYLITDLERQSGERFDFYIYRLDCFLGEACEHGFAPGPFYAEIVVLQDGEVFDTIRAYTDTWVRMNCPPTLILERDDGLLVCNGWGPGTRGTAFEFYLLRDGSFVHIAGDLVNPSFDLDNQLVRTVQRLAGGTPGFAWVVSQIVDDVLVPVSSLYNVWDTEREVFVWRHEQWVDGEWEVVEDIEVVADGMDGLGLHPYGDEYWQAYWFGDQWQ